MTLLLSTRRKILMSIQQSEVKTRIWWRVTTRTIVAGKVSDYVDWYYGPTAEFACELAGEDAHRYGLPNDATFAARLATADETRICESNA